MTKIRIYGRPGCSECGHALAFLGDLGVELEPHDLSREKLTREVLEEVIPDDRVEQCLDRQSPFYRLFGLDQKTPSRKRVIRLILGEPGLLKVPMVVGDRGTAFGWSPERFAELFGEKEEGGA